VDRFVRLLFSLGTAGALANARAALDQQRRDEWLVDSLVSRLERVDQPLAAATVAAVA
jgi:hypothetical protein